MVYILCIFLLSVFFLFTLKFQRKQLQFVLFAFIGIILLVTSSMLYSFRMTGVYTSAAFIKFKFIYSTAQYFKLTFSDIYRLSLLGSFCIYCSLLSMVFNTRPAKNIYFALATFFPLFIYLFMNDPDINFLLYLRKYLLISNTELVILFINAYNFFINAVYFLSPLAAVFIYYKNTSFVIKKKHAVFLMIYIVVYYLLLFIMNSVGLIHFFQNANIHIFKYSEGPVSDFSLSIILIAMCIILILIVVLTFKTSKMQNFSTSAIIKNTNLLDKNLRMILHTYKNQFFVINQQVRLLKSLDEPYSEKASDLLNSLDTFSTDALSEISERINALQNIKLLYKPVNLTECADSAVDKLFTPPQIKIIKDYSAKNAVIFSEKKCMTEMIFNLLQNSVEAFNISLEKEQPIIKIKIAEEPNWILLEITDNGCGINNEQKKNLFLPLFSSKQGKNNFGIGLHYVKKIISAHNGYIFVDSTPGSYTKFQIYLPSTPYREENNTWNKLKLKL